MWSLLRRCFVGAYATHHNSGVNLRETDGQNVDKYMRDVKAQFSLKYPNLLVEDVQSKVFLFHNESYVCLVC